MKTIGPDRTFIDYFQSVCAIQAGLNRFGIRVRDGRCLAVIRYLDGHANTPGRSYQIPVSFETLPSFIQMIIEDHLLNYPTSDLAEVLGGRKSFEDALGSPFEVQRAIRIQPLSKAS